MQREDALSSQLGQRVQQHRPAAGFRTGYGYIRRCHGRTWRRSHDTLLQLQCAEVTEYMHSAAVTVIICTIEGHP